MPILGRSYADQLAQAMEDTFDDDETVTSWANQVRTLGAEVVRLREALRHIADGDVPSYHKSPVRDIRAFARATLHEAAQSTTAPIIEVRKPMVETEQCAECNIRLNQDNAGEESVCCDYCVSREPDVGFLSRVVPDPDSDPDFALWLDAR